MKPVCDVKRQIELDDFPVVLPGCNSRPPSQKQYAEAGFFKLDQTQQIPSPGCRQVESRYVGDMESLTARKVIVKEVNIAEEKAQAIAAAESELVEANKAANERLEQMAFEIPDSLTFRILIALAERGEKVTETTVYTEARKQLELPTK